MAKEFSKKFYNSTKWRRCRKEYAQSVNGLCENCLRNGKITPGKEVHHKIELTPNNIDDPFIALSWDNLELLCFECHQSHRYENKGVTREGLEFDENGDLVEVYNGKSERTL